MYRFFFIAKNNMKKQKSDMKTFFVMILLSAMLIFISMSFISGIPNVIDSVHEKTNGPEVLYMLYSGEEAEAKMTELLKGSNYISEIETTDSLGLSVKYGHTKDKQLTESTFQFVSYDQDIKVEKPSLDTKGLRGKDIVLPVSMSTSYKIGETIRIKINDNVYDLKVAGYNEDSIYCSPLNLGITLCYVSDSVYNDIDFENNSSGYATVKVFKAKLTKEAIRRNYEIQGIMDSITSEYNTWLDTYRIDHPGATGGIMVDVPYDMLRGSAMILPYMFLGIICAFAVIMFIIAMVVIHFSVKNFIITNMKNTAIMEAAGYTVNELIAILVVQLVSVALVASAVGVLIGALLIGRLGVIIVITMGLSWNQAVSMDLALGVALGLCLIVTGLTFLIGSDYSKTTVLEALRGGVNAHNFKKNFFPFEKSAFPVAITLSLKETFGRFKSNIGVIFIMMVLMASTILSLGSADTFSSNDALMKMVGFDYADISVYCDEAMAQYVSAMPMVKRLYGETNASFLYTSKKVNKERNFNTRGFSDITQNQNLSPIEGRVPIHDNEVMLATNAAKMLKVSVGDVVSAKNGNSEETYLVTGLCQVMNNMGQMGYMSLEGFEKISGHQNMLSYMVFLKDGYTIDDFKEVFLKDYPDVEVTDFKQAAEGTIGVVKSGVKAVAVLIAFLTAIIVAFVESLIIKTQITRSWRDLGVSKALGYTSKQLIIQTMLSNMPSVLIGCILGIIVAAGSSEKVMSILFSVFGFKKSIFYVNFSSYILATLLILGIALLTAGLIGKRIKTLEPVKMITEE
jgi:ABC-type antimicrobial peptide transport system permease subunit